MLLSELHIDHTRQYMVDVHGKKYPIKQQRGRFYIQHAKGQLTVTSVIKQPKTDCVFDYIFNGGFQTHPCPAMDYWIRRHRMKCRIYTRQFKHQYPQFFVHFKTALYKR